LPRLFLEQYLQKEYDHSLMAELMRIVEDAVNKLSEGRIYQHYNASSAAPTGDTVAYQLGDKVWNISPTPSGSPGSEYCVIGWLCVASGTPGTWREMRVLTGN
jgi:hypothetical protein